jgi:hypothetical protein
MRVCTTRLLLPFLCMPLAAGSLAGCESGYAEQEVQHISQHTEVHPATFARQWMTNAANSIRGDTVSPPVAARTYAYTAIAIYESVVHGMPGYDSLAGQLNGLDSLPKPDPELEYDWPSVLAHTLHLLMLASIPTDGLYTFPNRIFFEYTTPAQASLTNLGPTQIGFRRADGVPEHVIQNSMDFAGQLAGALIPWMRDDGYYDVRYAGWIPPVGPDKWVPTGFSDQDKVANPLEPHFGKVRPLVLADSSECSPGSLGLAPPPFSTDPDSEFYQEALHVYNAGQNLTDEQRLIARFWEDAPGATGTPAAHWVDITTQLVKNQDLATAAAAYAWVSIGFMDSFIAVWESKYEYNLLRPTTFIRRHIAPGWLTFLGTPQFPEYVSGHSGQSGASGRLLMAMFGDGPFVDDTKVRRGFAPRTFENFEEAADEAAISRLYGGIHYRFGNDHGLALGRCVADRIISRVDLSPGGSP